jgi:hypothetical protein
MLKKRRIKKKRKQMLKSKKKNMLLRFLKLMKKGNLLSFLRIIPLLLLSIFSKKRKQIQGSSGRTIQYRFL